MPVLDVELRQGVAALTSVVAVLHARTADVRALRYSTTDAAARLCIELGPAADPVRLSAQLARRVDVLGVREVSVAG